MVGLRKKEDVLGRHDSFRSTTFWFVTFQKLPKCTVVKHLCCCLNFFFLSLYTARPSFEYYRQVYFVHSGLQDESLQVTISKLP